MWVKGNSMSLKTAPFDRPYTTFYWSAIATIALSCTIFELFRRYTLYKRKCPPEETPFPAQITTLQVLIIITYFSFLAASHLMRGELLWETFLLVGRWLVGWSLVGHERDLWPNGILGLWLLLNTNRKPYPGNPTVPYLTSSVTPNWGSEPHIVI